MSATDGRAAADVVAAFLGTVSERAPEDSLHTAKRILLNGLRASLSASGEALPGLVAGSELARVGVGPGRSGLLWSDTRLPLEESVAVNVLSWTLLLLDDLDVVSGIHPGAPAACAALPLAVASGASGRDLLAAIVAGIEVQIALARASAPEMLQERGFAPLSVIAPLGAVSAAVVLGRPRPAVARDAVGIASMSGFGVWEMGGTASSLFLSGNATRLGVAALRAAALGVDAPPRALDGDFGAFRAYSGKPTDVLHEHLARLGADWTTTSVALQPFSGDTYSQAPLEAVRALKRRLGTRRCDDPVDAIIVTVQDRVALGVERKLARHPRVETALGLNSDPQSRVAAAWLHDVYTYSPAFADLVDDTRVAQLRYQVRFRADDAVPDMTAARVDVHFCDGEHESAHVDGFQGSARCELPDDDLSQWFAAAAEPLLGAERVDAILDQVWHLERAGTLTRLADAVFAAPSSDPAR